MLKFVSTLGDNQNGKIAYSNQKSKVPLGKSCFMTIGQSQQKQSFCLKLLLVQARNPAKADVSFINLTTVLLPQQAGNDLERR